MMCQVVEHGWSDTAQLQLAQTREEHIQWKLLNRSKCWASTPAAR
jgi:hypothetical protein